MIVDNYTNRQQIFYREEIWDPRLGGKIRQVPGQMSNIRHRAL